MSTTPLDRAVAAVERGEVVPDTELYELLKSVMLGLAPPDLVKLLLVGLHRRGEAISELVVAARVLREFMTRIPIHNRPVLDTCGTGGTGAGLFNISTASAIAAAACGVRIAKHGNRKVTSSTGSADVLHELGVNIDAPIEAVAKCIDEVGIGFCFAPKAHPAVKNVSEIRRSIPHPTLFNWIGPLCNPALAEYQVLGVGKAELLKKFPAVLEQLGVSRFAVLHSQDGLCEISTAAPTEVVVRRNGSIEHHVWTPEDFGVQTRGVGPAVVDSPQASASLIRRVFAGEEGVPRDLVVLNASAALWLADHELSLSAAAERVRSCLDRRDAERKLAELVSASQASVI